MNESKKSENNLRLIEEKRRSQFGESYFSVYHEDPKRLQMYKAECARIERLKPSGRILDVGCGIGLFLSQFSSDRWERYGTDISELAINESRLKGIKVKDYNNAYDYPEKYFDVIVFRGSLQHIPEPFSVIIKCIHLLTPGGYLIFLATPNSNSPYYRRFKTLPILTPHLNILIPSDIMMRNALQNFGLEVIEIRYPYLRSPYARPIRDHFLFFLSFFGIKFKFPFWRSVMEIYARKSCNK
jgi:2-polyprenyl-3-methyl-5-hydroxy-6-metoxy-1,4-benzoquinol methylase